MGERVPGGAEVGRVGAYGTLGAAISGEDDGAEPGADHAPDPRYGEDGEVRVKRSRRHRFPLRYSHEDVALLASVDTAHETLSGPATQKILQAPVL